MYTISALLVFTPLIRDIDNLNGNLDLYTKGNYLDTLLDAIFDDI